MTGRARHDALLALERSHDGPIPPWEREAAIRGARTERENIEHDLKRARWNLEDRRDTARAYNHEVSARFKIMRKSQSAPDWRGAFRHWSEGRKDLRFYLSAFTLQRALVHRLEAQLAARGGPAPTNRSKAP